MSEKLRNTAAHTARGEEARVSLDFESSAPGVEHAVAWKGTRRVVKYSRNKASGTADSEPCAFVWVLDALR